MLIGLHEKATLHQVDWMEGMPQCDKCKNVLHGVTYKKKSTESNATKDHSLCSQCMDAKDIAYYDQITLQTFPFHWKPLKNNGETVFHALKLTDILTLPQRKVMMV
jgi:hypothetical protein